MITQILSIKNWFINFFTKGHERSIRAKKNIVLSFFFKGINIGTSLLLVPLVLTYLDQTRYGIWLTLASLVGWFNFFDVGLGHGLRNKLSESLAKGNIELSRKYVSTTYAVLFLISIAFIVLFLLVNTALDWTFILNTNAVPQNELSLLAIIVFGFFALRLVSQLIFSVLYANQKPAMTDMIRTIGNVLNLSIIYILLNTTNGSLLYLALSYSAAPILVISIFSILLFSKSYKHLSPHFKYVEFGLLKDLFNLGVKFFIIQIAAVILYTTDNMIITQLFSPAEVTPYQIAHRYFGIIMIGFSIILSPSWSAITEAYTKGEKVWIKRAIKKFVNLWIFTTLSLILMLLLSNKAYTLWIGDKVNIPFALSVAWALFVGLQSLNTIFIQFINGTGKVKLQMLIGISGAIINIPLSILLANYFNMGVVGVISATIIGQFIALYFSIAQYHKIINGKLYGIWGK